MRERRFLYLENPELCKQYSSKNERPVEMLTPASSHKYWWECEICSYTWEARVSDRNKKGSGCPYCMGKMPNSTNSLRTLYPKIAHEYAQDLNDIPLDQVFASSGHKSWWRCKSEHTWQATSNARTQNKTGCPYCDGRLVTPERNLAALYPAIAAEFNVERNFPITPGTLTPTSGRKFWWKCENNHEWFNSVASRTSRPVHKCAFCSGAKTDEANSIKAKNPKLAAQYHPTKNTQRIEELSEFSHESVWWICETDASHEWKSEVATRSSGAGCFYCFGAGVDDKNSLRVVNPALAKEFDLVKNFPLTPETVRAGRKKSVWWKCEQAGHSWEAAPAARNQTHSPTGCPACPTSKHTSKIEGCLRNALMQSGVIKNITIDHHNKTELRFGSKKWVVVDILGEHAGVKVAVEYDGQRWHSGALDKTPGYSVRKDIEKTELLLNAGYLVIRVRENVSKKLPLPFLPITHPNLLQLTHDYGKHGRDVEKAAEAIGVWLLERDVL